jgi:type II secretory pathway component PulF
MPIFYCRVIDARGRTEAFVREATSEEVLIRELNREEIYPLEVRETSALPTARARRRRFSRGAVMEFTESVSLLLSSGLTFRDALDIAQTIFLKGEVNQMIVHLLEEIRKGSSVYEALERLGGAFPPVFRGFVRIGEKIGSLEGAFRQLGEYLREERKIRDKLGSSLIYPVLVLVVAMVGITGVATFVLPRVKDMFDQLGSELPARITAMMRLLNGAIAFGAVVLGGLIVAGLVLTVLRRSDTALAETLDRLVLKVPVLGRMRYLREVLNLLFAMETLTGGGFTIEDALAESARIVGNRAFRAGLLSAREAIVRGESLAAALLSTPVFSPRIGRWVAVGERSGQIEQVFGQLRRYYQGEIEKWSARFMSLVEPVLILLVGAIIFAIVFFFIIPIFSLYEGLL